MCIRDRATTVVIAYIRGDTAYVINVGDSRAYRFRNGSLLQLTEDHTYVNELLKSGVITADEARSHSQKNVITRAVGAERSVRADFFQAGLEKNDILMLCSDGLYGEVNEQKPVSYTHLLTADEALKIFKYDYDTSDKLHTVIPILGGGHRWGTLVATRYEPEFSEADLVLGEYGATVVGLEIQRRKALEEEEEARQRAVVQMAIGTLSYSEIEAVQQIFAELKGSEGLLVASKIADRSGITRSVIVNALRKLESARCV